VKLVRLQKAVLNISSIHHPTAFLSRWLSIARYALRSIGIEAELLKLVTQRREGLNCVPQIKDRSLLCVKICERRVKEGRSTWDWSHSAERASVACLK